MKFLYFLLFLLSINLNIFSQSKEIIYVNENFEKIDFKTFSKKLNSEFFLASLVEKDTAIFKKLRFKEYFGNLGLKKSQLNKLYLQRHTIDSTKIWLIHYIDSLPNAKKMPKESGIVFFDENGKETFVSNSEYNNYKKNFRRSYDNPLLKKHKHVSSYKDYKRNTLKEIKRFKKYEKASLFHFYNFNKGFPVHEIKNFWIKDENEILKKSFSDGQLQYKFLLIYPNGDFYASHYFKPFSDQKRLLNKKSFKKLEKKWLKRFKKLN